MLKLMTFGTDLRLTCLDRRAGGLVIYCSSAGGAQSPLDGHRLQLVTSAVARGAVAGGQGQAGRKMLLAVGCLVGYGAWEHSTWLWDTPPHPQPCSMHPQIVDFRKKHRYLACPLADKGFCPLCHVSTAASPFSKLHRFVAQAVPGY